MLLDGYNRLIQIRCLGKDSSGAMVPQFLIEKEGSQPVYVFRYLRFICTEYEDGNGKIQFSKLQFFSDDGQIFDYGSDRTATTYQSEVSPYPGETLTNVLTNSTAETGFSKFCGKVNSTPINFDIDLLSERLNLKTYNNWRFYYSNDSDPSEEGPRRIKHFKLLASNTNTDWDNAVIVDDKTDTQKYPQPTNSPTDYGLAYCGKIKLYSKE